MCGSGGCRAMLAVVERFGWGPLGSTGLVSLEVGVGLFHPPGLPLGKGGGPASAGLLKAANLSRKELDMLAGLLL